MFKTSVTDLYGHRAGSRPHYPHQSSLFGVTTFRGHARVVVRWRRQRNRVPDKFYALSEGYRGVPTLISNLYAQRQVGQ